ncbi:glycosyltransferase [Rhizobium lusitanum]|uniref:Glycosyltransferase n=1 Tax=Rhizobium lusitanum TaxID=293958 RepID=A0A6L9U997_9HYPH|nr:glycosyltransferase [Rhizobium lusitanum]NEI71961.1 glycosyltransferase [Rhizobium lusitanum]
MDPSTRYRCFNVAAALARNGLKVSVISQSRFEKNIDLLGDFDRYIFHRPMISDILGNFLHKKQQSEKIVADFDDFIFDVRFAKLMPAHRFRGVSLTDTARFLARNASASRYFSNFSLSTSPLADEVFRIFTPKNVVVSSNSLDPAFQGIANIYRTKVSNKDRAYRFGYFAGTATHDSDLASIAPAIVEALKADKHARMLILGPIKLPDPFKGFEARIEHRKQVVPFHQLPAVMAQVQTVIAPLEINNFTRCKSGLKFFEAAAVGCAVVATPIPDIERFESPLLRKVNGFDEWSEALLRPFELSERQVENAAKAVCRLVDSDTVALKWLERIS